MKTAFTILAILALCVTVTKAQQHTKTIFRYGEEVKIKPDTSAAIKKFTGTYREGKVYLNWVVYNNRKNGMYVIERSLDNKEFEVIGFKKGIGTTLPLELAFYYTDNVELKGKVTYKVTHIADDNTYFQFPELAVRDRKNQKSMSAGTAQIPVLSISGAIHNR